jgi:hypothetical protein
MAVVVLLVENPLAAQDPYQEEGGLGKGLG